MHSNPLRTQKAQISSYDDLHTYVLENLAPDGHYELFSRGPPPTKFTKEDFDSHKEVFMDETVDDALRLLIRLPSVDNQPNATQFHVKQEPPGPPREMKTKILRNDDEYHSAKSMKISWKPAVSG